MPSKIVQHALPIRTLLVAGNRRVSVKRLSDDSASAVFGKIHADNPIIILLPPFDQTVRFYLRVDSGKIEARLADFGLDAQF